MRTIWFSVAVALFPIAWIAATRMMQSGNGTARADSARRFGVDWTVRDLNHSFQGTLRRPDGTVTWLRIGISGAARSGDSMSFVYVMSSTEDFIENGVGNVSLTSGRISIGSLQGEIERGPAGTLVLRSHRSAAEEWMLTN